MMLKNLAGAGTVLLAGLTGCGAVNQQAINTGIQACYAQTPKVVGNYVRLADCLNQVEGTTIYGLSPTLVGLHMAARRAIAEKVDNRQISPADAELEFAKLGVEIEDAIDARSAARQAAITNSLNAAANAFSNIKGPQLLASPVINTNCWGGGGYWNCTTH